MRGSGERRWETACESAGDSQGLNAPTFDSTFETYEITFVTQFQLAGGAFYT